MLAALRLFLLIILHFKRDFSNFLLWVSDEYKTNINHAELSRLISSNIHIVYNLFPHGTLQKRHSFCYHTPVRPLIVIPSVDKMLCVVFGCSPTPDVSLCNTRGIGLSALLITRTDHQKHKCWRCCSELKKNSHMRVVVGRFVGMLLHLLEAWGSVVVKALRY